MAVKLRLGFPKLHLPSAFKLFLRPLLVTGLLGGLWRWQLNPLVLAGFLTGGFLLYIYPLLNSLVFLTSFLTLLGLAVAALALLAPTGWQAAFLIAVLAALLSLTLGLKNLTVGNRDYWYYVVHQGIVYLLLFTAALIVDRATVVAAIGAAAVVFFVFREFFRIITGETAARVAILASVLALVVGEFLWLLHWLAVSSLVLTNLVFLIVYLMETVVLLRYEGVPTMVLVRRNLAVAAAVTAVIVAGG